MITLIEYRYRCADCKRHTVKVVMPTDGDVDLAMILSGYCKNCRGEHRLEKY